MKICCLTSLLALAAASVVPAFSAVIVSDSFTDLSAWTAGTTFTNSIETDSSEFFAKGPTNTYLSLTAVQSTSVHALNHVAYSGLGTTGQISFDFYDPQIPGNGGEGYLIRFGSGNANSSTAFGFMLRRGSIVPTTGSSLASAAAAGTYSYSQLHSLQITFNNSSLAITYGTNGEYTLASRTMDIWMDGTRVATGLAASGGGVVGTDVTSFNISDKAGFRGTLYFDNLEIRTDITAGVSAVPEPATTAVGAGLVALAAAAYVRRRRAG